MHKFLTIVFLIMAVTTFAQQKKVNEYEYIIVKERFNFLKKIDEHKTSSLTKFLLKKNGFKVYLNSEELPTEIKLNPCNALEAEVESKSSMFRTKLIIVLKDCNGKVVYTSKVGESKEKDYKKSFQKAIRNAHLTMNTLRYSKNITLSKTEEVVLNQLPVEKTENKLSPKKEVEVTKVHKASKKKVSENRLKTLYAQPKKNGFQLIDEKPEIIFVILNTTKSDLFILKEKNGLLFKKGQVWIAEYYKNNVLVKETYQIKF